MLPGASFGWFCTEEDEGKENKDRESVLRNNPMVAAMDSRKTGLVLGFVLWEDLYSYAATVNIFVMSSVNFYLLNS